MFGKRSRKLGLGLIVFLAPAFVASLAVYADEKAVQEESPMPGVPTAFEPGDLDVYSALLSEKANDPLLLELKEARRSGDLETCRLLEAQIRRNTGTGDEEGDMVLHKSTTLGGPGDLQETSGGSMQKENLSGPSITKFGSDIHVRNGNLDTGEWNQTMVSDSKGNLYIAWQDDYFNKDYIQLYWSKDGGKAWLSYGYVQNKAADLKDPCIAVGEGNQNRLLLAYIVDDGINMPYPETATATLGQSNFTFHSVPVYTNMEYYAKPVIWTDAHKYSVWYAYLVCEAVYDKTAENINIMAWRSVDNGNTWVDGQTICGAYDVYPWVDPDGSFGTTKNHVFVTCYNKHNQRIYILSSHDSGISYTLYAPGIPAPGLSSSLVDPEIEAAPNYDHILLCCTFKGTVYPKVAYTKGKYYGGSISLTKLDALPGQEESEMQYDIALTANPGGTSFHVAYKNNYKRVFYNKLNQDFQSDWHAKPYIVDDLGEASYDEICIASNWTTDTPGIAWRDNRDGSSDYDTYFDSPIISGLSVNVYKMDQHYGGTADFLLKGSPYRNYILLGTISGIEPGIPLPGGTVLPLNWDLFTSAVLNLINTPVFDKFMGKLSAFGYDYAHMNLPPIPGMGGTTMHFAFTLLGPCDYVSNPVAIKITY